MGACNETDASKYTFIGFVSIHLLRELVGEKVLNTVENSQSRGEKKPLWKVALGQCGEDFGNLPSKCFHL